MTKTNTPTDQTTTHETRLLEAFAKVLASIPNPKTDAVNPQFRKNGKGGGYITLKALLEHAKEHLGKQGLAITQSLYSEDGRLGVDTIVIGHGARWSIGRLSIRTPDNATIQMVGSQLTYLKRQSIMAGLGIAGDGSEADDDGNAASGDKAGNDSW